MNALQRLRLRTIQSATWRYGLLALFFSGVALALARPALGAPFFADDLHLVRAYSADELRSVWTGPWDTDGIETAGYRPLTTVFNHLRAVLFGEEVVLQRLFLLALFVLFLLLAALLAHRLGQTSIGVGVLGGSLALTHVTSTYHYLWISDGVHLAGGLLILAAIVLLLHALRTQRARWLAGSAGCAVLSLLVREDNLIVLSLLLLFALAYGWRSHTWPHRWRRPLIVYTLLLLGSAALFWMLRSRFVPTAVGLRLEVGDYLWTVGQTVQNFGDATNLIVWWPDYDRLIGLWLVSLGGLLVIAVFGLSSAGRRSALVWFGAMLIAALPGLTLPRTNLLLLAAAFWGWCVATLVWDFAHRSWPAAIVAIVIVGLAIGGSAWGSTTLQVDSTPANLDWICGEPEWVYGQYASATIPAPRREAVRAQLERYGIFSMADVWTRYPQLVAEAAAAHRIGANDRDAPFIPRLSFIVYPGWQDWSCLSGAGWQFRTPQ